MSYLQRIVTIVFIGGLFLSATWVHAQSEAAVIDTLAVDIWPDFDRAAVLVLITGILPPDTTFPVAVTIPLPNAADLNAVARITVDNVMTDDIQYTLGLDSVTFVTPDARFRIEYYLPYTATDVQREFTFTWLADVTVNNIEVAVQQPVMATNMHTQPAAVSIGTDSTDGFTYYVLPATAVAAGQPYTVQVDYTLSEPVLSVNRLPLAPAASGAAATGTPAANTGDNWPLWLAALGGILIIVALVWQVVSNRQQRQRRPQSQRPPKLTPQRPPSAARFCHECGAALQTDDKFCRHCGTAVKRPRP